ncbi:hypothetical protein SLEP1_g53087 [Rubroshorea leprosula]|uniref:Polyprotein n=1 Tax=Rubroshorea leprosula TaxID=152421 RepID=A0AAV5M8B0_9ROSI|nr:hypothetical protein SLEP1_g53087 [Rubroshorea leprosula]
MAQFQASQPLEGLSTTKPPFFDGTNYNYWKNRMKVFMLANVPKAWIVTMKERCQRKKLNGMMKPLEKIMINNKAISMLQCALNPTKYNRVSRCDTAKEMWDMLKVTHEGTSQVKESKINRIIDKYELFKIKPEESIQDMYTRLNDIVTNLKALGKVVVRKVFKSLLKNWEAKKTTIEESKDLNTLKLEDLIGKLMTYEIEVQVDGGVEVVEKKKKDVAFKASNQKEKSEDDASDGENTSALISREVRRFMKKNIKSKLAKRNEGKSTKKSVKCYKCNKMEHYRNECPKLKKGDKKDKKSMKKKAFVATWSDDETSSMESESCLEKGVANLCFMAQEDSNNDEEVCLVSKMKNKWYLDNGCSKHMTSDPSQFSSLMPLDGGIVTFGGNGKGIVKGIVLFVGKRLKNVYVIDLHDIDADICLASIFHDDIGLWHRRLGNASMSVISKLLKHDLVDGLPKVNVDIDNVCDACMKGKQTRVSFKAKKHISTSRPLELLHMDLFGPMCILSIGGKSYVLVVVDDYSRFTWVAFLAHKKYAVDAFKCFYKKLQNEKGLAIFSIRSDHGGEFAKMTLKIFALNMDSLEKFDSKSDEGIFVGYSTSSKTYRVYNKRTKVAEESIHVVFDETNPICFRKSCDDDDDDADAIGEKIKDINLKDDNTKEAQDEKNEGDKHEEVQQTHELKEPTFARERSYVKGNEIIGDPSKEVTTRSHAHNTCAFVAFISQIEPSNLDDKFEDVNTSIVRAIIALNCTVGQINVGLLTLENRALQWIISRILAQRKGSKVIVFGGDLLWFDYLLKRKRLNIRRFIYRNLIKNYSSNMGLPHGALITRLVKRNNIDLTPYRLGKIQGDEEEGDADQEMVEHEEEEHGGDSPRPFRASMQRTNRKTMELMINEMRQLHIDFYGFRTEMRGRMDSMDGKLDQLINHFFPPPPPSAT